MSDREWLKPPEVAASLGVKTVRVQRWLAAGTLRGKKIGGLWFVHRSELEAGYDAERARSKRGDPVLSETGSALGGDGDDVESRRPSAIPPSA